MAVAAGRDLRAWWQTHAPAHLRDLPVEPGERDVVESDEDRAERLARQAAAKNAQWRHRLPTRYAAASLDSLVEQQDPEGRVRGWLDSAAVTLVLAGPADHGKTYAGYAVGNEAVARGYYALAWTVADLNAALRPGADLPERTYERAVGCDLLLLDDLGREQVTAWSLEQLQRILDARNRERRRTVVTTNLSYEQVADRYGSPVAGRLIDDAIIVKIEGERLRKAAPW